MGLMQVTTFRPGGLGQKWGWDTEEEMALYKGSGGSGVLSIGKMRTCTRVEGQMEGTYVPPTKSTDTRPGVSYVPSTYWASLGLLGTAKGDQIKMFPHKLSGDTSANRVSETH